MDVLASDPKRFYKVSSMAPDFFKMPDLAKRFPDLDADSLATLRRFIAKLYLMSDAPHLYSAPRYAVLWGGICTQEEFDTALANEKQAQELMAQYHLHSAEVCSLVYHHGLRFLPQSVLAYLKGTVFIDGGAFQGDSSLVFLQYKPCQVWAFEPSPPNREIFRATMRANHVSDDVVRLIPKGLSEKHSTIRFNAHVSGGCSLEKKGGSKAELVPLDSLTPPTRIGLIKADLEGMGMSMLRGAVQTIKRDKPVLALSFYHNSDEFLNTYPFVKGLGLPYTYKVLSLSPPWSNYELTLLAYPSHLQ